MPRPGQAPLPMLTPKGVSSFFSTGSPDVLLVSMGTQGRKLGLGTCCVSSSSSPPRPGPSWPLGVRVSCTLCPASAPGPRHSLPPAWGTHPLERRRLQQEGERAVRWGGEPESPPPLGLTPTRAGDGMGWDRRWDVRREDAGGPFPSGLRSTRYVALFGQPRGRESSGAWDARGAALVGQGGQHPTSGAGPRGKWARPPHTAIRAQGAAGERGRGSGWPSHRGWGPRG